MLPPDNHREGIAAMTSNRRWKQRPPGSTWGDFGPDDQLGRLNLLTPEKVRKGTAGGREGRSFSPSLPPDYRGGTVPTPRRHPPPRRPTEGGGKPVINYPLSRHDHRH